MPARHRGRGVGTALLQEISDRVRQLGKEGLQVEARSDDAYSLGYLERRGFVEVDRWAQLFLELETHEPVEPVPPPGVELAWLSDRPDLLEAMFTLAVGDAVATRPEAFRPGRSTSSATRACGSS